jgi:hypothetical protein
MKFYGWTYEQWALAFAGRKVPSNMQEVLNLKKEYLKKGWRDPIEKFTLYNPEGDTRERNYDAAEKVFLMEYTFTRTE